MERKLNIVPGEAPESDDEENTIYAGPKPITHETLHGSVIAGEAPESDTSSLSSQADEEVEHKDRSTACVNSAILPTTSQSVDGNQQFPPCSVVRDEIIYSSLLHKKLRERNTSLRRSVEDFVHETVDAAARDLNSIDQQLLKSQVTLQEAATCLRVVQSNLSQIHSKLTVATSSTYLPVIHVQFL